MITLGIETSCDETALCILKGRRILSQTVASSMKLHKKYGGVVPEIASRRHLECVLPCLDHVIRKAKIKLSQIDLIAATGGPGLMGSLLVGTSCAKSLALVLKRPVVFVDHVLAHAFSGQWGRKKETFPFIALVVSGGHSLLIHWKSPRSLKIIGKTQDDAAGEAFDKVAKMLGLGYPGGPVIDRLSRNVDPTLYSFPRPLLLEENFNFSFSGLKTSVFYRLQDLKKKKKRLTPKDKASIASAFQEAVCDCLVQKSLRALRKFRVSELVVGGGVSANTRLQEKLSQEGQAEGLKITFPEKGLSEDNAVMIAYLGQAMASQHKKALVRNSAWQRALGFKAYSDFYGDQVKIAVS